MLMSKTSLQEKILSARQEGRLALLPFLPAGFPSKQQFWQEIKALDDHGADIIEIGIPFSDPMADGPVVDQASQKSLSQGVNISWLLDNLKQLRSTISSEIILMGYVNPFMQYGWSNLASEAEQCDISGIIVPDLPLEESMEIQNILDKKGIELIPLIGLNTSKKRMAMYAEHPRSFVYFVSVLGTTGARKDLPLELKTKLQEASEMFSCPLVLGFGISHPDQLKDLKKYVQGVVFGSSLIQHIEEGGHSADFMSRWLGS